jgi:hypothetical protein
MLNILAMYSQTEHHSQFPTTEIFRTPFPTPPTPLSPPLLFCLLTEENRAEPDPSPVTLPAGDGEGDAPE